VRKASALHDGRDGGGTGNRRNYYRRTCAATHERKACNAGEQAEQRGERYLLAQPSALPRHINAFGKHFLFVILT
jgi:hypothetical protein